MMTGSIPSVLKPTTNGATAGTTGHPFLFVAGMGLTPQAKGFEQTFELGWFDELEFLAHAPGCEPQRIRCDTRGACFPE